MPVKNPSFSSREKYLFKKGNQVKKYLSAGILLVFLFGNVLGCAPLILGAAVGAAGGYAVSKDTVQGETDKSYQSIWDSAMLVAKIRGKLKQQDQGRGYIYVESESGRVWIRLIRLTRATTRLKVSARHYHMPNLSLAQELYTKIMDEAR